MIISQIFKPALVLGLFIITISSAAQDRPQTPVEPFPYKAIEVSYQVKQDTSVHLYATLTMPNGKGPFSAILIIGGSGQTQRDQPFYNHRTMAVLADYLTKQGYATLRFDDRGAGKSTGGSKKYYEWVEADYLADAEAGINFLKSHPLIDGKSVGVIGQSAGATQGLILATTSELNLSFSIMLCGTVNNYPHLIVAHQSKAMAKASNKSEISQKADSTFIARSIYYTINEANYEKRLKAITSIAEEELTKLPFSEREILKNGFNARVNILSSKQFYDAAQERQENYLLKVKCPVLILLGGKDLNVDADYYKPIMSASMKKNYNKKSALHILPNMNHMLQNAETGLSEESNDISETVNQEVLDILGKWLAKLKNK